MKKQVIFLVLTFVFALTVCGAVKADIPVCTVPGAQYNPAIYGNIVVWVDERNGNPDIYMKDLSTGREAPVCTEGHDQWSPAIWGNKVVWVDMRNGDPDIYMKDLSTGKETPICAEGHDQWRPAIYGNIVVWEDMRNDAGFQYENMDIYMENTDVYMKDLSTGRETPVCTERHGQYGPAIYGDKIVWEDVRNGNPDIYMYDLSTGKEIPICTNPANQWHPVIWGNIVIWEDMRNDPGLQYPYPDFYQNKDIYMKDLSTGKETPVCAEGHDQWRPAIYGNIVVWEDWRNDGEAFNLDIYMKDLSTGKESPICTNPMDQFEPAIYGNKVVWTDMRNGDGDIYMRDLDIEPPGALRIFGANRIKTANKIAAAGWSRSEFAILTRSDIFPDALSGGPLSEFYCPILLTSPTQINKSTLHRLRMLQTKKIIILGGTKAVSEDVETILKQKGFEVERIAGPDRYATSAEIAKRLKEKGVNKVLITTSTNFPDALAAAPYAAKENAAILLTDPKNLPEPTKDAINFLGVKEVTILGSTVAVSQNVEDQLKAMGLSVSRIAGLDRYETAVKIAEKMNSNKVIIATGENFPDALAGGAFAIKEDAIILLVKKDQVPQSVRDYLIKNRRSFTQVWILGSEVAVSKSVEEEIGKILG